MDGIQILVPLAATLIGGAIFLVPIAGLTARFALKPVIDAIVRMKQADGAGERQMLLEQRLSLLEEQMHALEREQSRLVEEAEFRRQLEGPRV